MPSHHGHCQYAPITHPHSRVALSHTRCSPASLCVLPWWAAEFFTFCHFAQGPTNTNPTWTVTTYGTLISTPQSGLSYFVTDISGTRVQTGANPSTSTITGLATPGSVSNGRNSNTNQISVAFPFLDYGGIAYSLSAAVTLPPNATGGTSTTNTIDLFNQPPCEAGTCTWTNAYNPGIPRQTPHYTHLSPRPPSSSSALTLLPSVLFCPVFQSSTPVWHTSSFSLRRMDCTPPARAALPR